MSTWYMLYKTPYEVEGKTPAEACGMELKGENKWITLIQNVSIMAKPI